MNLVSHNKTKNIYILLEEKVKNCTNDRDGQEMVFYASPDGMKFTRDRAEFWEKFTEIDPVKIQILK